MSNRAVLLVEAEIGKTVDFESDIDEFTSMKADVKDKHSRTLVKAGNIDLYLVTTDSRGRS